MINICGEKISDEMNDRLEAKINGIKEEIEKIPKGDMAPSKTVIKIHRENYELMLNYMRKALETEGV